MDTYWLHLSQDISSDDYNILEFQIHQLAQYITLTGINMLKPETDDSHTNLGWDPLSRQLYGHTFNSGGKSYRIAFGVGTFKYKIITDGEKTVSEFDTENKTFSELAEWWTASMRMLKPNSDINNKLHYELPDYGLNNDSLVIRPERDIIDQWVKLRTHASLVLSNAKLLLDTSGDIRIWPHHFDTGLYIPFNIVDGGETSSIGLGLAIADSMINEPYFYIYGWQKEKQISHKDSPGLRNGKWLTGNWNGAVLTYTEIASGGGQHGMASRFFEETVSWYRQKLDLK